MTMPVGEISVRQALEPWDRCCDTDWQEIGERVVPLLPFQSVAQFEMGFDAVALNFIRKRSAFLNAWWDDKFVSSLPENLIAEWPIPVFIESNILNHWEGQWPTNPEP